MNGANRTLREKFSTPEEARFWAQWIALAPFAFQAARSLRNLGVFDALKESPGARFEELQRKLGLSEYALSVLLDAGESCALIDVQNTVDSKPVYRLAPAGEHLLSDALTQANFNFTGDVCYDGLAHLEQSLRAGKPEGLKVFGEWPTIYAGLTQLPAPVLKSWCEFDHYFSDDAFPRAIPIVLKDKPKRVLDVGGNTGKFAVACALHDPEVTLTMLDHPAQLELAGEAIRERGLISRIDRVPMNLLDHSRPFPGGQDAVWMSQFLDCFGKEDILALMKRARDALSENGSFFIMETFIDRQRYDAARFCLDMTSLYFTSMANGNSRMYRATDFIELLEKAGLKVVEDLHVRLSHTLLKCKRA